MSATSVLFAGREAAERLMVDTCTIYAPGGAPVFNPDTGDYETPERDVVYSGRCRVQVPGEVAAARDVAAGEREWTSQHVIVALPVVGSEAVRVDHTVHMDDVVHDQALVDREFGVRALHHKTHATSRRLRCEEVTG